MTLPPSSDPSLLQIVLSYQVNGINLVGLGEVGDVVLIVPLRAGCVCNAGRDNERSMALDMLAGIGHVSAYMI